MSKHISLLTLRLVKINEVEKPPFLYLQQFYEFEFSPLTLYDTDENGLYDYKKLQDSWHHHYDAFLFYLDKLPIGLAVVNLASQITYDTNTRDIAEFFVMPNYRHYGIGSKMAMELFNLYPGTWEVRQLVDATLSRKFWLKVISQYATGKFTELKCNDDVWRGYFQRFEAPQLELIKTK